MPNCDASFSYLGNFIEQNSKVNISGYSNISINFSPIRKGNPYFEVKGYSGTKTFTFGFQINNYQILLFPLDKLKYYIYDAMWQFTGESPEKIANNNNYCLPLKHSFLCNETIGIGLCIENKTFVVVHNDTYEAFPINFPDNSLIVPIVREIQINNAWDIISFNFGTKFLFEYNFPGFSPFCLAEHLCKISCKFSQQDYFNIAFLAVIIFIF